MNNKTLSIIEELNEEQVILFIKFASKSKLQKQNNIDLSFLNEVSLKSKIEFYRLILILLVSEHSELGLKLESELLKNENQLKFHRLQGSTRSNYLAENIQEISILLGLLLSKVSVSYENKQLKVDISYGSKTEEILKTITKLSKHLKISIKKFIDDNE